jgi:hypothetical protein
MSDILFYFLWWIAWALVLWWAYKLAGFNSAPILRSVVPPYEPQQTVTINVGGIPGHLVATGKGYVVGVAIFYPDEEELQFVVPDNMETEEAVAILRKYKVPV